MLSRLRCSGSWRWFFAFGMTMAVGRYDQRRAAVVDDANAIRHDLPAGADARFAPSRSTCSCATRIPAFALSDLVPGSTRPWRSRTAGGCSGRLGALLARPRRLAHSDSGAGLRRDAQRDDYVTAVSAGLASTTGSPPRCFCSRSTARCRAHSTGLLYLAIPCVATVILASGKVVSIAPPGHCSTSIADCGPDMPDMPWSRQACPSEPRPPPRGRAASSPASGSTRTPLRTCARAPWDSNPRPPGTKNPGLYQLSHDLRAGTEFSGCWQPARRSSRGTERRTSNPRAGGFESSRARSECASFSPAYERRQV